MKAGRVGRRKPETREPPLRDCQREGARDASFWRLRLFGGVFLKRAAWERLAVIAVAAEDLVFVLAWLAGESDENLVVALRGCFG